MIARPIDANDVTNSVRSWYETAGWWAFALSILVFLLWLVSAIAISKKAGFSGWWGVLYILVLPLSPILFALFAILRWPVLKERNEALGVLREHAIPLPSHERAAIKEEERKRAAEEEARRNMERAMREREKAEAERARMAARGAAAPAAIPSSIVEDVPSSPPAVASPPPPPTPAAGTEVPKAPGSSAAAPPPPPPPPPPSPN